MKPWQYIVIAAGIVAIVAFIYSNNRDEESEVFGRGDDTSQSTTAGAFDATMYTLNPQASLELLLEQSGLPEEIVPGLTEAQRLYVEAMSKPAAEAIPLLEACVDQLEATAEQVENMAGDSSNQVSADNYRRLSQSILVVRDRVQSDLDLLEETGSPVTQASYERIAA